VLPERKPHITFDSTGTCTFCRQHADARSSKTPSRLLETDLVKRIERHRGRSEYDCVLHCTGGLDTISALYLACKRFRIRPLVVAIDNGFENPIAVANVERAVNALGVDRIALRDTSLTPLVEQMVRTDSQASICAVCNLWTTQRIYRFAELYKVRLVLNGLTKGHLADPSDEGGEFSSITQATRRFLADVVGRDRRYRDLPRTMRKLTGKHRKIEVLSVHWFLPQNPEDHREDIERELGWQPPEGSYPSHNIKSHCKLDLCNAQRDLKHHGLTYHHVEASRLIRLGLLSRDEALAALSGHPDPDEVAGVLSDLRRFAGQR